MEYKLVIVIASGLMLAVSVSVAYSIFQLITDYLKSIFDNHNFFHTNSRFEHLKKVYEPFLLSRFPYYNLLSDKKKFRFLIRLHRFQKVKKFRGGDGLIITEEMKVFTSASAVQLTLGLNYYTLEHFHTIIIYPGIFKAPLQDEWHKGHINLKGFIVLSWEHFKEGYETNADRLNLGLHEMAHALDLSRRIDSLQHYFTYYYSKWLQVALLEFENISNERASFLRSYAGVNIHEFFAVCVEYFFEDPVGFRSHLPDIYKHMCLLLKQDTAALAEKRDEVLQFISNAPKENYPTFSMDVSVPFSLWTDFFNYITFTLSVLGLSIAVNHFYYGYGIVVFLILQYLYFAVLFTKVEIGNGYIIIAKPLFNREIVIALPNLIAVQIFTYKTDSIIITYFDNGEVKEYKSACSFSKKHATVMMNYLKRENVSVSW